MKKIVLLMTLCFINIAMVLAVPAYPGLITVEQPDGTTLSIYLKGDEYFHYRVTEDGYLLQLNESGILEYATLAEDMTIKPLGFKAYNINERSAREKRFLKKVDNFKDIRYRVTDFRNKIIERKFVKDRTKSGSFPCFGSPKGLVILVNYKDVHFTSPEANANFKAMMSQPGYSANGATSSALEYFQASSFGQFSPDFVVVGPYDLPYERKFYGEDRGGRRGVDANPDSMIIHACQIAHENGINFNDFDTDGDSILDNVFVYYAGYNQAEYGGDDCIWPHRGEVQGDTRIDGIKLKVYSCTSEMRGNKNSNPERTQCGIGTFCHEFSHVLELPDMYITDYSSDHPTLEKWDLMDQGPYINEGRTPPLYSAYERFFVGWLRPEPLDSIKGIHKLPALASSNKAYIFSDEPHNMDGRNPNPPQFFLFENRQKVGLDSVALEELGEGMLITRIDYRPFLWMGGWNNPNKDENDQCIQIMCAAGTTEQPSLNTFPGAADVPVYNIQFKNGKYWPEPITSIHEIAGDTIEFIFGRDENTPAIILSDKIKEFNVANGDTAFQVINIKSYNISSDIRIFAENGRHFGLRLHKDGEKSTQIEREIVLTPSSKDSCDFTIEIVFRPRKVSYGKLLTDKIGISSDEFITSINVEGISTRPIKVTTPIAYPATEVTENSFVSNWSYDEFATGYYLYVYNKTDERSEQLEKFGVFGNGKPEGWKYNFSTTNKTFTASAPLSLLFTSKNDTLWTPKYFLPVDTFSFWTRSLYNAGTVYVDGLVDGTWINLLKQEFSATTSNKYFGKSVSEECYQFKIYVELKEESPKKGLLFDNFYVEHKNKVDYVLKHEEVFDTTYYIGNCDPNKLYYYKVCATDKEITDKTGKYENVTPYSNEIKVSGVTIDETDKKADRTLNVSYVLKDGGEIDHYIVHLESLKPNHKLYIYNFAGEVIEVITPTSEDVVLNPLMNGIYFVKYSEVGKMKRKDKVGKIIA